MVALILAAVFFWVKSGKDDITVAYNSPAIASAPVFADVGNAHHLKINRKPNATGRLALDALLGGQANVATVADVPVINGSLQRQDLRIILTICESPIEIVARKHDIIDRRSEGKKIGTFDGTSPKYFLSSRAVTGWN